MTRTFGVNFMPFTAGMFLLSNFNEFQSECKYLVRLHECFYRDNTFHLVMEFMNVGNLSKLMELLNTQKLLLKSILKEPKLFPNNQRSIPHADWLTKNEVTNNPVVLKSMYDRILNNPEMYYQRFAQGNILTELECSLLIRSVLEGLRYLRKKHIIHRDST